MLDSRRSQVAKNLCDVFIGDRLAGFEFDDEHAFDEQIGKVFAERRAVFIEYGDRHLLLDVDALFATIPALSFYFRITLRESNLR